MSFMNRWFTQFSRGYSNFAQGTLNKQQDAGEFDAFEFSVKHNGADFVRIVAPLNYFAHCDKPGYRVLQIPMSVVQEIITEKNKLKEGGSND